VSTIVRRLPSEPKPFLEDGVGYADVSMDAATHSLLAEYKFSE
jgi:hypothetical protein